MHFLKEEIEFLASFARTVEQFAELLEMAAEPVQLLADVAAFGQKGRFLRKARRLDAGAAEQFLQAILQAARKRWCQRGGEFTDPFGLLADAREAAAQFLGQMASFGV